MCNIPICVYTYNNNRDAGNAGESQMKQTFNTIFMDFASSIFICEIISVSASHVNCRICKQGGSFTNYASLTLSSLYSNR